MCLEPEAYFPFPLCITTPPLRFTKSLLLVWYLRKPTLRVIYVHITLAFRPALYPRHQNDFHAEDPTPSWPRYQRCIFFTLSFVPGKERNTPGGTIVRRKNVLVEPNGRYVSSTIHHRPAWLIPTLYSVYQKLQWLPHIPSQKYNIYVYM